MSPPSGRTTATRTGLGGILGTAVALLFAQTLGCAASGTHSPSGVAGSSGSAGSSGAAGVGGTAGIVATGTGGAAGAAIGVGGAAGAPPTGVAGQTAAAGAGGGATDGGTNDGPAADGKAPLVGVNNFDGAVFFVTLNDGTFSAFQEGTWTQIGKWTGLPILDAARGIDADPETGIIYISHGGAGPNSNGAPNKNGSLLAWSLITNSVVFDVHFTHGVDQIAVGDGLVYVPSGEYTNDTNWYYVKSSDGSQVGVETGGMNPHDTIFKNSHRYYGGTQDTYLYVLGLPIMRVGPSPSGTAGVRPFTINGDETRAYITWSNYRGFSVADLTTGKIIKTVNFGPNTCGLAAPSHGMTLSPDNSEVYVLDTCLNQVKVFDASDNPQMKTAVALAHPIHPGTENPCVWDCDKDGWITHSHDGKYVYVGDSGDVIDTSTRTASAFIAPLANCRHGFIEMDYSHGAIIGTATHVGVGY